MSQMQITVPDPSKANPKDVIDFIADYTVDAVKQAYDQLIEMNIKIPEDLDSIFQVKISTGSLYKQKYYWDTSIEDYQIEKENLSRYTRDYDFEVKGLQSEKYQENLSECIVFEKVQLKNDPGNQFDSNAIKIVAESGLIGYVPKVETNNLHKIMAVEHKAFIESISDIDGYIEATVKVYHN